MYIELRNLKFTVFLLTSGSHFLIICPYVSILHMIYTPWYTFLWFCKLQYHLSSLPLHAIVSINANPAFPLLWYIDVLQRLQYICFGSWQHVSLVHSSGPASLYWVCVWVSVGVYAYMFMCAYVCFAKTQQTNVFSPSLPSPVLCGSRDLTTRYC